MVTHTRLTACIFVVLMLVLSASAEYVSAQNLTYKVDHQWTQVFINQDGTVDLIYNLTITVTSGTLRSFDVGQPNQNFSIGKAIDQYGNQLVTYKYTDDVASVDFKTPLNVGEHIGYTITTNVANMVYNDTSNPGNLGMQFIPQWIDNVPINDVLVQIVLPSDVNTEDVKTTENYYNGTSTVGGRLSVYWVKPQIAAGEQFRVGVSFPANYLPNYTPTLDRNKNVTTSVLFAIVTTLIIIIIFAVLLSKSLSKKNTYNTPKIGMETLGIKRGLTAVEASYLLNLKPQQIVTEILYSLLQKQAVWTVETNPSLKLKILPPYENKTNTTEKPLQYYEIDFLHALNPDGSLDETKLAHTIMLLRDTVTQKIEGYNHKETVDHYRKIVSQAWEQVEQAGTELASNAYNEQLLWIMMDPNQRARTETVFHNRPFTPNPMWLWWWYGYTRYNPHHIHAPNINVPTQSPKLGPIPGTEFANNIATSVEKTSNNIVANLEKFANAIVPPPPKPKSQSTSSKEGCVCACACACVSCACACAGGGGR